MTNTWLYIFTLLLLTYIVPIIMEYGADLLRSRRKRKRKRKI